MQGHVKEDFTRNSNTACISSDTMTSLVCRVGASSFGTRKFLVLLVLGLKDLKLLMLMLLRN